jgi:hypothetical protein
MRRHDGREKLGPHCTIVEIEKVNPRLNIWLG